MDESTSLKEGVDILSESFVFVVAGTCLAIELWNKHVQKVLEAGIKREKDLERAKLLESTLCRIDNRLESLKSSQISMLSRLECLQIEEAGESSPRFYSWFPSRWFNTNNDS